MNNTEKAVILILGVILFCLGFIMGRITIVKNIDSVNPVIPIQSVEPELPLPEIDMWDLPINAKGFISTLAPYAREINRDYGIPASVLLAQAIVETDHGRLINCNNIFGIKSKHRKTITVKCSGKSRKQYSIFKAYKNINDSLEDYAVLLTEKERYAEALECSDNPFRFIEKVHLAGYARNPEYAKMVKRVIIKYDLRQYDE